MKGHEISIHICFRPSLSEPVELRHAEVTRNMQQIGPPLGWKGLQVPPVPDFGPDVVVGFQVKYPIRGVVCGGTYNYRHKNQEDHSSDDDRLRTYFKTSNPHIDYRTTLREQLPKLVAAYRSYRAIVFFDLYRDQYTGGSKKTNPTYNRLRADKPINMDARNNIFTLEPAMYWDALLCQRALGYGRDEVIRRLQGKVPLVMPLMDGVYTVFSDDPDLSYEEFVAINDRCKPILGLI